MDKRKTRTRTTRKMGKLDHNHERAQTTPHNEHKHQNMTWRERMDITKEIKKAENKRWLNLSISPSWAVLTVLFSKSSHFKTLQCYSTKKNDLHYFSSNLSPRSFTTARHLFWTTFTQHAPVEAFHPESWLSEFWICPKSYVSCSQVCPHCIPK
jgi:hypothetical protein